MKNNDNDLMKQLCSSEELDIYGSTSLMHLIDYKWDSHA